MPVMDGIDATRAIRTVERELPSSFPKTRIVALTCFGSQDVQKAAEAAGVDLFLVKPVKMGMLGRILAGGDGEIGKTQYPGPSETLTC